MEHSGHFVADGHATPRERQYDYIRVVREFGQSLRHNTTSLVSVRCPPADGQRAR